MKKILSTYAIIMLFVFSSCKEKNETVKRTTIAMGTMMEVQIRSVDEQTANNAINEVFAEIKRIDTLFSTYIKGNEMWRINNTDSEQIAVNDEIFEMLKRCDVLWSETNGAFDPAIGNLIELVGFQKDDPQLPTPEKIKSALKDVGWKHIKLIEPNIMQNPKHVKISFNACVPGYAADKAAQILINKFGINDFLVNAGGEIFAKGKDWVIGIQHPRKQNDFIQMVMINDLSITTSGDYQQYFTKNGKRYTHIFNPITGLPANECESVSIIAKDTFTSDALSTGVFVMGPDKGIELIEKLPDVECLIVDSTGTVRMSSGFEKFFMRE